MITDLAAALPQWWQGVMASFYGGIGEELLLRFFLMTLLIWVLSKFFRPVDGKVSAGVAWTSIIVVAIVFGLLHLKKEFLGKLYYE